MQVPREKLELRESVAGKESKQGWLVIALRGLDLDGVTSLEVDLDQLDQLRSSKSQGASLYEQLVKKLS